MELSITHHWHSPETTVEISNVKFKAWLWAWHLNKTKKTECSPWIFKRIVNALYLAIIGLFFQDVTSSTSLCHSSTSSCRRAMSGRSPYPKARLQSRGAAQSSSSRTSQFCFLSVAFPSPLCSWYMEWEKWGAAASRQPRVSAGEAAQLWHVAGWRRMKK